MSPLIYESPPVQYLDRTMEHLRDDSTSWIESSGKTSEEPEEVIIRGSGGRQLEAFVTLAPLEQPEEIDAHALIDSGCTGSCIDSRFVSRYHIPTKRYIAPLKVSNADGSENEGGLITEYVETELIIGSHKESIRLSVTQLSSSNIFLGYDWLSKHNPEIDWEKGTIDLNRCPDSAQCVTMEQPVQHETLRLRKVGRKLVKVGGVRHAIRKVQMRNTGITEEPRKWPEYLDEYADVFSEKGFERLPQHRSWDHAIELKPDFKPSECKIYPLNPQEQEALKEFIQENLESGRIRPSKSPMASPFFFIKKEDGSLRAIQDYRKLNEGTIKNKYPLPLINELIDKVKDAKFITKLDVRWGYYNIRLREGDEWKAAFRTNLGLFEPTVMFFGLCNAPATFQAFVNTIFKELIHRDVVVIYLDDILIFSRDQHSHRQVVQEVMRILKDNQLYLKPQKCEFEVSTVKYLGHIIGNGEVRMDPKKADAVRDWPVPKNVHEVQQFLGLGNVTKLP